MRSGRRAVRKDGKSERKTKLKSSDRVETSKAMPIHVDCVEARELMKAIAFATMLVSLSESDKTWGRTNDLHSQMDTVKLTIRTIFWMGRTLKLSFEQKNLDCYNSLNKQT